MAKSLIVSCLTDCSESPFRTNCMTANKKGKPFSFKLGVGEVIKGWDIGVAGLQVGGERRLSIPSNLAYGSKGAPGIPGNSDLIFDIKLLEIKK
jgi:FK506-binding nuclear protein